MSLLFACIGVNAQMKVIINKSAGGVDIYPFNESTKITFNKGDINLSSGTTSIKYSPRDIKEMIFGSIAVSGDANKDGQVSVADLALMASFILGESIDVEKDNADVNSDGEITVADLAAVASMILNGGSISTDSIVGECPHEYVDLGLSVKWATCNIGADKPEDYGDYFAWGETTGYGQDTSDGHQFGWANYKWCNGSSSTMTKYCTSSSYGTVDSKSVLDPEDDAAHVNWGGSWRMPTQAEHKELRDNCTWTWTTQNGINGYKVTSKSNGNSIFLPAAGCRSDSCLYVAGSGGRYWSSSLRTSYSYYAYYLYFNSSIVDWASDYRYYGLSVRAVCQ